MNITWVTLGLSLSQIESGSGKQSERIFGTLASLCANPVRLPMNSRLRSTTECRPQLSECHVAALTGSRCGIAGHDSSRDPLAV